MMTSKENNLNIAVTGTTGFLGRHLTHQLAQNGYTVHPILRSDFANEDLLSKKLNNATAVIHCAGIVSYKKSDKATLFESNVNLTRTILKASKDAKIKRFVHVSSIVTLGYGSANELRDESSSFNAYDLNLDYWNTKFDAEKFALSENSDNFQVVVVNPGTFLGPGDIKNTVTPMVQKLARHAFLLLPPGGSDFIDVRDVAMGTVLALKNGKAGEKYILGSENLTYIDLHRRIRAIIGKKSYSKTLYGLGLASKVLQYIENNFSEISFISSSKLRRINNIYLFHRHEKALRELGFKANPIDGAILSSLELKQ